LVQQLALSVPVNLEAWQAALQADSILTGGSVVDLMNEIALSRQLPCAITVDHGTEFTSKALDQWCCVRGEKPDFIRPGKPMENGFIKSINERLRDERLNDGSNQRPFWHPAAARTGRLLCRSIQIGTCCIV
jgi:transposase InsO family protein